MIYPFKLIEKYEDSSIKLMLIAVVFGFLAFLSILVLKTGKTIPGIIGVVFFFICAIMVFLSVSGVVHKLYFGLVLRKLTDFSKNTLSFWILVTINIGLILLWGREEIKITFVNIPLVWIGGYACLTILTFIKLFYKESENHKQSTGFKLALILIGSIILYGGLILFIMLLAYVDLREIYYLIKDVVSYTLSM